MKPPYRGDLPKIGQLETQNDADERYKYTGQREVVSIGLYYYGARYYDPSIGRFITEDSWPGEIANPQSQNLYIYVVNNPLRYIDPTGHKYVEHDGGGYPWTPPETDPGKKLIDSGGSGSKPSFYLNLKPNLNPLLDLNGDYSFENDWDMITGTDVRITLEQMKNSMDIESIAPKFELKGGLISLEHTQSWPAKITFFGGTKVENITKIKININPGSEWSISSDGTSISYQKGDLGISINNKGELVINNGRGTTEIKEGGYNLDRYTHWIIEGGSNNFFNVKTSSKSLIFSSNWLPFKEVAGGYIPFAEYSVEVSDKQGYISLTNQTTISIHRDIRDFAYFALGGVIGYEGIELVNRLLSSGYRRPAVGY